MNKENINKLIEVIEQSDHFYMDEYHDCGTPWCIAGHAAALEVINSDYPEYYNDIHQCILLIENNQLVYKNKFHEQISDVAKRFLGLSENMADELFTPENEYANYDATQFFIDDDGLESDIKNSRYIDKDRAIKQLKYLLKHEKLDYTWSK